MLPQVVTVSALNRSAREILQRNFPLLWVAGEISNIANAASGHVYFSLKDASAQVRCVMFRNRVQLLPWKLENGQQVEAQALVTLFEARGDFQLNVEAVRRAGIGARYEAYVRLRDKLEHEGLFAAARKRRLPRFPRHVGIVTSAQAAALQDVLSTLRRRAPQVQATLFAVPVQGDAAAEKIAAAIVAACRQDSANPVDVLILVRGGGSIEDLWAFNEEVVARAIAASLVPVVCGVGHETDITIADFVADQRAATPTAAAELISAGWFSAVQQLSVLRSGLRGALRALIDVGMQRIDILSHRLIHPGAHLDRQRQALAHLATRLFAALAKRLRRDAILLEELRTRLARQRPAVAANAARVALVRELLAGAWRSDLGLKRGRLGELAAALAQLSPQATLDRGYSIIHDEQGRVIRASSQLATGDAVDLRFASGWAKARIDEIG